MRIPMILAAFPPLLLPIAAAHADPLYLTCTLQNTNVKYYMVVDYAGGTVATSFSNGRPWTDDQGRTAIAAQITDSQINWTIDHSRSQRLVTNWSINRLDGTASSVDTGSGALTTDPYSYNCAPGQKPAAKF